MNQKQLRKAVYVSGRKPDDLLHVYVPGLASGQVFVDDFRIAMQLQRAMREIVGQHHAEKDKK